MLRSSLPLKNEAFGDYSENVADTHKLIASIHLAQGNIEKSLRSYKKVDLIISQEVIYGPLLCQPTN